MDILDRIVEAVAQKLISMRLEEAITMKDIQTARTNIAAKKSGREKQAASGQKYGHSGEKTQVKPLTGREAGASGNKRGRFSSGGDLASGTKEDPFNRAARNKPIKPEISKTEGPKGGKEGKRGVES
jgi:hypothetical protein